MRGLLLLIALLLGLPFLAPAAAQGADGLDAGTVLWRAGDRDGAAAAWRAALDELARTDPERALGGERARLAYNLGNAAYRAGAPLEAVGWYTVSRRLAPRDASARANLDLARAEAGLEPLDRGDLLGTLLGAARTTTPVEARWLALFGVLALVVGAAVEAVRGGAAGRIALLTGGLVLVACWTPFVAHALGPVGERAVVVEPDGLAARSEPRPDARRLAEVAPGREVTVTDRYLDWARVRTGEGELWVRADGLFSLEL